MRGHVRKRGKGWVYVLSIGRDLTTGKRKQKWSRSFKTKKEAERELNKAINEIENGIFVEPNKVTLGEYLENWLEDYARGAVRPTTFSSYRFAIRTHIAPHLGSLTLQELQATHIQRFYNNKLESGRVDGKGGLAASTIQYMHTVLQKALEHAVKWQLINRNVAKLSDPPKIRKRENATFGAEEVKRFLTYAKGHRLYIAFLLGITTGLRKGEILGLRWNDVALEEKMLSVRKSLALVDGKRVLQEPKTSGSIRSVPLPSLVVQALEEHKLLQSKEKIKLGALYHDHGLVVTTSIGKPVSPSDLWKYFKSILKKADLPNIRFHDLRHTHATLMLQQGEHPKIVAERLGHSDIRLTMDTYSHVLPNMQQEAVERFEKMFLSDE
ncbi:Site-specific recombinase XerD [Thermoactinomyces sp. DSM 45891]|uniref:site-specific integrase n=1 Tax=Thermoactinomyces sp. DSM 45891 TaxID=1761907 RepID=UPI00091A012E|nr:tyrosine-type recombinase/integrase [Thermoactinomyces sp. DSM 45891]SFX53770.1 Site-specific recombinase XerD [Thermoactinomyces sp. DSM 45891]